MNDYWDDNGGYSNQGVRNQNINNDNRYEGSSYESNQVGYPQARPSAGGNYGRLQAQGYNYPQPQASQAGYPQTRPDANYGRPQAQAQGYNYPQPQAQGYNYPQPQASQAGYPQARPDANYGRPQAQGYKYSQPQPSQLGYSRSTQPSANYGRPQAQGYNYPQQSTPVSLSNQEGRYASDSQSYYPQPSSNRYPLSKRVDSDPQDNFSRGGDYMSDEASYSYSLNNDRRSMNRPQSSSFRSRDSGVQSMNRPGYYDPKGANYSDSQNVDHSSERNYNYLPEGDYGNEYGPTNYDPRGGPSYYPKPRGR